MQFQLGFIPKNCIQEICQNSERGLGRSGRLAQINYINIVLICLIRQIRVQIINFYRVLRRSFRANGFDDRKR